MKKLMLIILALPLSVQLNAQGAMSAYLDINNIKARVNGEGSLFWDLAVGQFEVPKGSGLGTIYADNLWIGGLDAGGNLKIAAQTYRQTGTDFWPGPLDGSASTNPTADSLMNKIWMVKSCDITAYHNWVINGSVGACPLDSAAAYTILNWPAYSPYGLPLAPYYDYNMDNNYDPASGGDYPLIKGDQAAFFVYNDKADVHSETGGSPLGVEIQTMVYEYSCPDSALQNTIFVDYKIVNRSSFALHDVYVGKWTDFDIGYWGDDFVGSDVTRGAYYAFNGDGDDDGFYGDHPGAQAVVFLKGPHADPNGLADPADSTANGMGYGDSIVDNEQLGLSKFLYYYNGNHPVYGNPYLAQHFYNYISGTWLDNTPMVYGGDGTGSGTPADYMFPGSSDPFGFGTNGVPQAPWDEVSSGNFPYDRRGIGASGPFTFLPGAVQELELAYVFGRNYTDTGSVASVANMNERIDTIKARYQNGIPSCGCSISTGIQSNNLLNPNLVIYPNPASTVLNIVTGSEFKTGVVQIIDLAGRVISEKVIDNSNVSLEVGSINAGIYFVKLSNGKNTSVQRFVKQ